MFRMAQMLVEFGLRCFIGWANRASQERKREEELERQMKREIGLFAIAAMTDRRQRAEKWIAEGRDSMAVGRWLAEELGRVRAWAFAEFERAEDTLGEVVALAARAAVPVARRVEPVAVAR